MVISKPSLEPSSFPTLPLYVLSVSDYQTLVFILGLENTQKGLKNPVEIWAEIELKIPLTAVKGGGSRP